MFYWLFNIENDSFTILDAIEKLIDQKIPQQKLEGFNYIQEPVIRSQEKQPARRRRNSRSSQFGRRR